MDLDNEELEATRILHGVTKRKEESRMEKRAEYYNLIIIILMGIFLLSSIYLVVINSRIKEKLDIYEQNYDNYCLEDALKQQEG